MSENRPCLSSNNMQSSERCTSPQNQNSAVRKSTRLIKPSLNTGWRPTSSQSNQAVLQAHQDSVASTSNALASPITEDTSDTTTAAGSSKEMTGKLRNYLKWDPGTENLFFDALKLYGKDIIAIAKYITQKKKTKAFTAKLYYDQARNFYHNTATKVFRLLDLSEINISKDVKELFALINYGEWKRKTNGLKLNAKRIKFFSNLVLNGWTSIKLGARANGKSTGKKKRPVCVIRTPMCPALRRFIDGKDDMLIDTSMPKNVTVELSPNTQRDRAYILGCWQNPFIRFELNLNQSVSEWLRWLQHKWMPQDLRMKKSLLGEDVTNELADITLLPSADMILRTATLSPTGARPTVMSASSVHSTTGATSTSFVNLGLRYCFGSKTSLLSGERREPWAPSSPGKNDRKRRKSTPVNAEADQQLSPAEISPQNKAKRFRADAASPNLEDGGPGGSGIGTSRQLSDGGDGESSCDAAPMVGTVVEMDDERDISGLAADQLDTSQDNGLQIPEKNVISEKPEFCSKDENDIAPNRQQQQLVHGILLNCDVLRNGLSLSNCESLTLGQLCLMCDRTRILRFKYTITPKTANNVVDPSDSWNFFVNLVRSDFLDSSNKKASGPLRTTVVLPPEAAPAPAATIMTSKIHTVKESISVPSTPEPGSEDIMKTLDKSIAEQQRQRQIVDAVTGDVVFAVPQGGKSKKKPANADAKPLMPPQFPAQVATESNAFLQQIEQMIKKPVVVNRRRAVVAPQALPTNKISIPPSAAALGNQFQRQISDQGMLLFIPPSIPNAVSTATLNRGNSVEQALATGEAVYQIVESGDPVVKSQVMTPPVIGHGSALNTPDVSLMRLSPEPVSNTPLTEHPNTGNESGNKETCVAIGAAANEQAGPSQRQPDLITSDSFLDFSLGSFPGFSQKSVGSPKRMEKEPISSVVHSLRLESDESALMSPPRLTRAGANAMHKDMAKNFHQFDGISNSSQFPSSSNLFPLLDAAGDNESSNTRNYFAACAMSATLETPEKCKDDDRR